MTKIAGSGSGFISQRHGSADPDPNPPQNVMDPQHCKWPIAASTDLAETVLDLVLVLGLEAHAQRPRDGLQGLNLLLHNQLI